MTNREACLILNLLSGIGPVKVRKLLDYFDSEESILHATEQDLSNISGIGTKLAQRLSNWQNHVDLEKEYALMEKHDVDFITYNETAYSASLSEINDPPLVLYYKGNINLLEKAESSGLAVVGSRRATLYGEMMTRKLVASASGSDFVIVSGLALGIDTIAHQSCLEFNGQTIAVLGGGLGKIYPDDNNELAVTIANEGLLISEMAMSIKPDRRSFPMRNRIISGLCPSTLVVEAGIQSGSLITAEKAFEQNRRVYAVPGRADSEQSRGTNNLIRNGAKLTESLDDICDDLTILPGFELSNDPKNHLQSSLSVTDLGQNESRIFEVLKSGDMGFDDLVEATGIPVNELLTTLFEMEMKRIVKQLPGKQFCLYDTAMKN